MKIFIKQGWHLVSLLVLIKGILFYLESDNAMEGSFSGINSLNWFVLAIVVPIAHQLYVLFCWRLELYYKGLTRTFRHNAFKLFKIGFAVLIISRPLTIILLSYSNRNTIDINSSYTTVIALLLLLPVAYLFYSLKRYFGINQAFGIDHFEPEKFKNMPYVRRGIFKYTGNAMYVFGFMALWIPGIFFRSEAGLIAALFSHLYIWVHYYFTERPDMYVIYGKENQ